MVADNPTHTCERCGRQTHRGFRYCSRACAGAARAIPAVDRFWAMVNKTPDGCWLWRAALSYGYGHFTIRRGHAIQAHRFAWELANGQIPDGVVVCHNCPGGDNPRCVRPSHMFLGSHTDNARDLMKKGRTRYRHESRPRAYTPRVPYTCIECGIVDMERPSWPRRFCSMMCRRLYERRTRRPCQPCAQCGAPTKQADKMYCSHACANTAARTSTPPTCIYCGQPRARSSDGACHPCAVKRRKRMDLTDRLQRNVDKTGTCWIWRRSTNKKGYGQITIEPGRTMLAHRLAWELARGPIPDGLSVCHHCDNPPCCRPDHLFLGTRADNNRDMEQKGRARKRGQPHHNRSVA